MIRLLPIFILIIQTFSSFGQTINFNGTIFDLSKLDDKNFYSSSNRDTVEKSDYYEGTLVSYGFGVFASNNLEYFLVYYDTTCIAPLGMETGCDTPSETYLYFFHKEKLKWKEFRQNDLGSVSFFEDNGASIISWGSAWAENYRLFYNASGAIIDTFSLGMQIYEFGNFQKIIVDNQRNKSNQVKCINSDGETIWLNEMPIDENNKRRFHSTMNMDKYAFEYTDSIVMFNSENEIIWNIKNPSYNSSMFFSYRGKYFLKNIFLEREQNRVLESYVLVFDVLTGEIVNKIETLKIKETPTKQLYAKWVRNSDYLYFVDLDRQKRIYHVLIMNSEGQEIVRHPSLEPVYSIKQINAGFEIYNREQITAIINN